MKFVCVCEGAIQASVTRVPGGGPTADPDPYHQEVSAQALFFSCLFKGKSQVGQKMCNYFHLQALHIGTTCVRRTGSSEDG